MPRLLRLMRRVQYAGIFLSLFFGMTSPAIAQDSADLRPLPSVVLPPELDRVLRDYESAWAAGDAEGLAALFTDDGVVRNPAGWIQGHEAIRAKYANAGGPLRLRGVSYSVGETAGYIVGAYGYGAGETFEDRGVFVLALRRGDAESPWLIAADLDNTITR